MSSTFDVINPATEKLVISLQEADVAQTDEIIAKAAKAYLTWKKVSPGDRANLLRRFSAIVTAHREELAQLEITNSGHTRGNALWEADNVANVLNYYAGAPERLFGKQIPVAGGVDITFKEPIGVVGIIVPWNFPMPIASWGFAAALAAGNTVVLKPAELTPMTAVRLAELALVAGIPEGVLNVIVGKGSVVGARFVTNPIVRKISFTGSTRTAKIVAAQCATTMTPVVLECGGKDPVIVAADANLERAVDATIWSAMANAGQSCIGAERVYVDERVADKFVELAVKLAKTIHAGAPGDGNYGPATMPSQIKVIQSHIKTAIKDGGSCAYGGPESVKPPFVQPVILLDVPEDSAAMREETFGPTIIINRVKTMREAVELSNASSYGLGANVWSKRQGKRIASELACGMVAINSTFSFAAVASVPFGGVKDSGYGRVHGPEGLLEYTYARTVVRTRFNVPLNLLSFKRKSKEENLVITLTRWLKGRFG